MHIDFAALPETALNSFQNGNSSIRAHMYKDAAGKSMHAVSPIGASIGMHRHETSFEIE
ncbi:MAG TPA: hypothetical protein O0X70_03115 [Methanocorpusculum sp.]|nr:hypothetical protein [Methanocorpusculum sp.]